MSYENYVKFRDALGLQKKLDAVNTIVSSL